LYYDYILGIKFEDEEKDKIKIQAIKLILLTLQNAI
jgi:hypothetical protein